MTKTKKGDVVGTGGPKRRLELPHKSLWPIDEWAEYHDVCVATVYNWGKRGIIKLVRVGPRATRVATSPEEFAASRQSIYASDGGVA